MTATTTTALTPYDPDAVGRLVTPEAAYLKLALAHLRAVVRASRAAREKGPDSPEAKAAAAEVERRRLDAEVLALQLPARQRPPKEKAPHLRVLFEFEGNRAAISLAEWGAWSSSVVGDDSAVLAGPLLKLAGRVFSPRMPPHTAAPGGYKGACLAAAEAAMRAFGGSAGEVIE